MKQTEIPCECGSGCDCAPAGHARWKTWLGLGILLAALAVGTFKLVQSHARPEPAAPVAGKDQPAAKAAGAEPSKDCGNGCEKTGSSCCGK